MPKGITTCRRPGPCSRCHQTIATGEYYVWSNFEKKRYHQTDETGHCKVEFAPAQPVLTADGEPTAPPDYPSPDDLNRGDFEPGDLAGPATDDLAAVIGRAVQKHLRFDPPAVATVDEATVRRLIEEALATRPHATLTIQPIETPAVTIEGAHYLLARVIPLVAAGIHVYLWGPAGTGKTTALMQIAKALGRTYEIDTLDGSTSRTMIQGYKNLRDDSPSHTQWTRCWGDRAADRPGGLYIADELDNAPGQVQTLYNSALANGHMSYAWGTIEHGADFGFAGAGNTPGLGQTPAFPDRRPMSAAFRDRLYFVHWPLDPAIEQRACGLPVSPAPYRKARTCSPQDWGQWVLAVRAYAATNAPTLMVTPRATLTGLLALSLGETPEEIAHGLVFRGADESMVAKVLTACPLPTGA